MRDASLIYRRSKVAVSSLGRYNICCPIVETSVERQSRPTGDVFSHLVGMIPTLGSDLASDATPSLPRPVIPPVRIRPGVGAYSTSNDRSVVVRDQPPKRIDHTP